MAWEYNDYEEQSTNAARLTRLRRHITEVGASIQANLTSGADSRTTDVLQRHMNDVLHPRRRELEKLVTVIEADDPRVRAGFTRGRPL